MDAAAITPSPARLVRLKAVKSSLGSPGIDRWMRSGGLGCAASAAIRRPTRPRCTSSARSRPLSCNKPMQLTTISTRCCANSRASAGASSAAIGHSSACGANARFCAAVKRRAIATVGKPIAGSSLAIT
jgi:hypothetical protein